ncbi:MAG: methyltransferase [Planctomycetes bacterium]|nr:methyltransferase [Planctomycetota bacterium]
MFNPVEGLLFDLITASPPYQKKKIWASGKSLTEFIIENADKHLSPKGSLNIICYLPDEFLYLLDSLKERFKPVSTIYALRAKTVMDGPRTIAPKDSLYMNSKTS